MKCLSSWYANTKPEGKVNDPKSEYNNGEINLRFCFLAHANLPTQSLLNPGMYFISGWQVSLQTT